MAAMYLRAPWLPESVFGDSRGSDVIRRWISLSGRLRVPRRRVFVCSGHSGRPPPLAVALRPQNNPPPDCRLTPLRQDKTSALVRRQAAHR